MKYILQIFLSHLFLVALPTIYSLEAACGFVVSELVYFDNHIIWCQYINNYDVIWGKRFFRVGVGKQL